LQNLIDRNGVFNCAALASFAKLFAIVSKYYAQDCLKSIKCSFPENWGMQKKFHVTFFSKNVSYHTFRPEKSNQSTFFTHKIAFYFSEISKFPEIDLLRKKGFNLLFLIQNEGKWCFSKKNRKKKFFHPPCFQEISILYFFRQSCA